MSDDRISQLKKAMETLKELEIPDHLEDTALKHLLMISPGAGNVGSIPSISTEKDGGAVTQSLRSFVEPLNIKAATSEIPTLLYWAKTHDGREDFDERAVVELYRLAGLRPPKDITQSFRDLASKKYLRLELVEGKRGSYRLSRTGEDYVIHDVLKTG